MTVGSLFSGIGGFDLGLERAGFDVRWQIEINADCVKVLSRHWPTVRRYRDISTMVYGRHRNRSKHGLILEPVDVLCGGFPCQDLSVAGKREGLSGSRSGLFFAFMRAVRLLKPKVVLIENVPGLLSSQRGRDFHTVLSQVAECGFRRAYRILDSQHFGIPQRRRRVFIVGCAREFQLRPDAILFESAGGHRDSSTREQKGPRVASTLRGRSHGAGVNAPGRGGEDDVNLVTGPLGGDNDGIGRRSADDPNLVFATLNSGGNDGGFRTEPGEHLIIGTLRASDGGVDCERAAANQLVVGVHANQRGEVRTSTLAGSLSTSRSGKQYEGVLIERARALVGSMHKRHDDDTDTLIPIASPITASAGHHGHSSPRGDGRDNLVYALGSHSGTDGEASNSNHASGGPVGLGISEDQSHSLRSGRVQQIAGVTAGVRRLTPLECERLQGFPDGWTCLCGEGHRSTAFCSCDDTYRYKGLGNAVSVPVSEWIAHRLKAEMEATA